MIGGEVNDQLFSTPKAESDEPFPGSAADFYERNQALQSEVVRLQNENAELKRGLERAVGYANHIKAKLAKVRDIVL